MTIPCKPKPKSKPKTGPVYLLECSLSARHSRIKKFKRLRKKDTLESAANNLKNASAYIVLFDCSVIGVYGDISSPGYNFSCNVGNDSMAWQNELDSAFCGGISHKAYNFGWISISRHPCTTNENGNFSRQHGFEKSLFLEGLGPLESSMLNFWTSFTKTTISSRRKRFGRWLTTRWKAETLSYTMVY